MFGPTDFLKMDEQLAENGFGPGDHGEAIPLNSNIWVQNFPMCR